MARTTRHARSRSRRGSALLLVLIFMLGFAALAMSAVYLRSSGVIVTKLYERERDYRYTAEAALQQAKSRVNKDTAWRATIPESSYVQLDAGRTMTDAQGQSIPRVLVNTYVGYTGDTVGRFGNFVTVLATAYDASGTRHVRRLDLAGESFSRYAMFTNSWPGGLSYGTGEFIRGRAHSNGNWASSGNPGPTYFDTVSAVGTVTGTANYSGIATVPSAPPIPFPTVTKLAFLAGYATTGNMNFAPVAGNFARATYNGVDVSGSANAQATRATRIDFTTVDVLADGQIGEEDGAIRVFDLAQGIDTARIRADLPGNPVALTNIVLMNQCGAMFTINGRQEFFPNASMRQAWVKNRIVTSTFPTVTVAQATAMNPSTRAGLVAVANLPTSRCFPVGSPYLLLTERLVDNVNCGQNFPNPAGGAPYLWASGPTCAAAVAYGGQDTTFTINPRTCVVDVSNANGRCSAGAPNSAVALGTWRTAPGGIQFPALPAGVRQANEQPYLFPISKPYNLNSKGVIYFSAGPVFASGTVRGYVTMYVLGNVGLVDDLTYDIDPGAALCRNFLGIIARDDIMITDNAMNRPKFVNTNVGYLLGTPHYTLHGITMSLTGTVGVENFGGNAQTTPSVQCGAGNNTSGGCINQTGGVIEQVISATYAGNGTGLRENRTVDPCQKTNRKPPFFPETGRYLDNKYYEIDPTLIGTPAQIRAFYNALRGHIVP